MKLPIVAKLLGLLLLATGRSDADDILIADFEGESYGRWTVTGEAFGAGPARGTLPGQMAVSGFKGRGLVNSFFKGDDTTGTLTSPEFRVERKYISFLIGGGKNEEKLALQLLVDGKVVRRATGPNDRPGGSETLVPESWNVEDLKGKAAVLRIIDDAKGGWGHINADHIVLTDTKPKGFVLNAERGFVGTSRFLNIPIKNGAPKRVMTLLVDGKPVVRNDMELADDKADWWAHMEIGSWRGKSLVLRVDKMPDDSSALSAIEQTDTLWNAANLYREPLRGQFHFSPKRGWNNDPNGCVYYNGEYHLFFQHNPYGWGWGNMHWGHAVSRDLVHWEELGDKLSPDEMGPMFSGSAVVDWQNTSGFGKKDQPPLVLFYTAAGNPAVQCLAYSTDGRTFTKYSGNPVVKQVTPGNRDPKVIWHEPTKQWVMVLYVELSGVHTIHFFTSPNLKDWTFTSKTDGFFECPDFFELAVDGDTARKKWVILGANSEYRVGVFDGRQFISESPKIPGHRGKGFYAAQSFSDVPDGRRIFIGWFQTETKGVPFNQSMTIPLDLRLTQTADGPRVAFAPVKELEVLRAKTKSIGPRTLQPGETNPLEEFRNELAEIRVDFEPAGAKEIAFNVRGCPIVYDVQKQELSVNGHRAASPLRNGKQGLTIFCDRAGMEVFASNGLTYVPMPFQPKPDNLTFGVESRGGPVKFNSIEAFELKSAWNLN